MKRKKTSLPAGRIALYDPYLDTLGGGEKHILLILKALQDYGYEVNIYWDKDLNNDIEKTLNLKLETPLRFIPNIFKTRQSAMSKLSHLSSFDIFFYITDGSYFFSGAKKNYIFCMVPKESLYPHHLLDKIKTLNYKYLANSRFTKGHLSRWNINADVIYPSIDQEFLNINEPKKEKIILSVGRFFKHLHAKKHDVIIKFFKNIRSQLSPLKDFKLIIAGGLKQEDETYFNELKTLIGDDNSIILKPNISHNELLDLYTKSLIYWHFTGFGVNEKESPELTEHLGITPLEAMAAGCIVFCYKAGGPLEFINDGENAFLFENKEELNKKMSLILRMGKESNLIRVAAKQYVANNFSYEMLKQKVSKLILNNTV